MSADRRKKVRELFEAARLLPTGERAAFLDEQCGDDTKLRDELYSLLSAHEGAPDFLSRPALGDDFQVAAPQPAPERIGKYRILSVLGEGGMGTVYEAEQESPRRKVALKVIAVGLRSPRVQHRFRLEAELLARLQHPGIAQIFEAGTFTEGEVERPYIAMELIEGVTLTEYATQHHLTPRQRLTLMAQVCDAVHHAHQKGVIHRDLKPANILVDAHGAPKILDFGIATATDAELQVTTAGTELGQLLGTLPYMSPEQVQGKLGDIDTRSDVYALGVICYRLLSGRLPLDLHDVAIAEAARVIAEQDPDPLSDFNRTLRGDVETIVAKALEKERGRRYQSASDMGSDIQRFLDDEAIAARPASKWYQFRKFSRRNKAWVAGATVAILGLVIGFIVMGFSLQRAVEAEAEARVEADKAGAISEFLQELLSSVDPAYGPGKETTVRQMLDSAAEDLERSFEEQPEVRAVLHDTIGLTYRNIGNLEGGQEHLEKALEILEADPDADPETLASTLNHVAGLYYKLDRPEEAEALVRRALEIRRGLYDESDELVLELQNNLAVQLQAQGRLAEAEELARSALETRRKSGSGSTVPELLTGMSTLATFLEQQGKLEEAGQLYLESLDGRRKALGDRHPDTLSSMHNMANFYQRLAKLEEAERFARKAVEGRTEIYHPDHPLTLRSLNALIFILGKSGKLEEAEVMARDLVARREAVSGPDHRETYVAMETLVMVLQESKQYAAAEPLSREIVAFFEKKRGENHMKTLVARYNLAKTQFEMGKTSEAIDLFRVVAAQGDEILDPGHYYRGLIHAKLGNCLVRAKRFDEAEEVLLGAFEICKENGIDPEKVIAELIGLYEQWGKSHQAEIWRTRLTEL